MNLENYYWWFDSIIPHRVCDEIIKYGLSFKQQLAVTGDFQNKKELTDIYVKHNSKGKTYEEFEAGMDRDNFLTAQEAIDWGLADEIVEKR